ncbi:MAG: hypothetical protein ATN36_02550 [Epulopiscium sp. Nele67-Bin005]|nr:MAG: hypothetical protein ATN36_02550 [Epulopiscium sp. Nele67-Bin005]
MINRKTIKITDTQNYSSHKDSNETIVNATIGIRNGTTYIKYTECEDGLHTNTLIKIKNGMVMVKREGAVNIQYEFQNGKSYSMMYPTPYGEMLMKMVTYGLSFDEIPLKLHIEYEIFINDLKSSENTFTIEQI